MAEIKWSEFPQDLTATPEDSEIVLLRGGQNRRAPGVNWKGDKGDTGDTGATGATGPQGPQGDPGAPGADGADGSTVLNGSGIPSAGLGVDGDFYIDTTNWDIYGPKAAGVWGAGTSLIGPQGPQGDAGADGADGAAGADGSTVLNGSGAPAGGTGVDGDFYIDTDVWDIYGPKATGVWGAGTSLIGPQGDPGTGYILQGSATVATLNGLDANLIGDSFAWIMLDSGTVQPINGVGSVAVVTDDLVVWAAPSLVFVNYGNQTGGGGGDVTGPATSVDNRLATFDGTSGKLIQDSGSLTTDFATAAQGVLADSAMQPGDNISDLNNNAGYGQGDVTGDTSSVNNRIATFFGTNGKVIQDSGSLVSDFATVAQATGSVTQHSDVTNAGSGAIITTGERNAITANTAKVSADGSIATHSDVTLTTPADKEGLVYNGSAFVNGFPYESGTVLPADPAPYPEGFLFLVTT